MIYNFTEQDKSSNLNCVILENENITVFADTIEGSGKTYILTGIAEIEGEKYHDFKVEFSLEKEPQETDFLKLMEYPWAEYDFLY